MTEITESKFKEVISLFEEVESFRGYVYQLVRKLMNKGCEKEAYTLFLSTWNFANFRFVMDKFDLEKFMNEMERLEPFFKKFDNKSFDDINFDSFEEEIKKIYTTLSKINGIKFTGASKIMHLRKPCIFVMWDGYIRREYGIRKKDYKGYIRFLKKMQNQFRNLSINEKPKRIDEYNYVSITKLKIIENKIKRTAKRIDKLESKIRSKKENKKLKKLKRELKDLKETKEKIRRAIT